MAKLTFKSLKRQISDAKSREEVADLGVQIVFDAGLPEAEAQELVDLAHKKASSFPMPSKNPKDLTDLLNRTIFTTRH